jgi:hypothetical protein
MGRPVSSVHRHPAEVADEVCRRDRHPSGLVPDLGEGCACVGDEHGPHRSPCGRDDGAGGGVALDAVHVAAWCQGDEVFGQPFVVGEDQDAPVLCDVVEFARQEIDADLVERVHGIVDDEELEGATLRHGQQRGE